MAPFNQALQATQSIAYAASIDLNAANGEYVIVGALTGAITVNAPGAPLLGQRLTLDFTQDATGGRVVTFNAAFLAAGFSPNTAASKRNTASFVYDGSKWVLTGSSTGL